MSEIQLPAAFETQMISLLGEVEFEQFKRGIEKPARTSIRLNEAKGFVPHFYAKNTHQQTNQIA